MLRYMSGLSRNMLRTQRKRRCSSTYIYLRR